MVTFHSYLRSRQIYDEAGVLSEVISMYIVHLLYYHLFLSTKLIPTFLLVPHCNYHQLPEPSPRCFLQQSCIPDSLQSGS